MQDMNTEGVVKELTLPLFNARFWMKLMGVVMIVYGVLVALSIVGLIIAWLPIWIGVLLFQSAGALESAFQTGDRDAAIRGFEKLKLYFVINGVLMLIGVILAVIVFMMVGVAGLMGMDAAMQGMGGY